MSIGVRWDSVPPAEQATLLDAYRSHTVSICVANFHNFGGQRFEVQPRRRTVGGELVVTSRIIPTDGAPRSLDYGTQRAGDRWKIVDVLLEGSISRVAAQRPDFRALMVSGGTVALRGSLRRKATDLQASP